MRHFTTHIDFFSQWQFPLQYSLKQENIARFTSSIIHMTQTLNIQSSTLKNVKLSELAGSVDKSNVYFLMICLLPKYWKLLPLSHTFIDHAVKHKKLWKINITVCLKYHKQKANKIFNEAIGHGRVTET